MINNEKALDNKSNSLGGKVCNIVNNGSGIADNNVN